MYITDLGSPTIQLSNEHYMVGTILGLLVLAGHWRIFTKANQPGWAVIIPIYSVYVTLKIIGKPWWWLLLLLVPILNFFVIIVICNNLAKAFGKGVGYTLLLLLLPFLAFPMLGFGDAKYQRPKVSK